MRLYKGTYPQMYKNEDPNFLETHKRTIDEQYKKEATVLLELYTSKASLEEASIEQLLCSIIAMKYLTITPYLELAKLDTMPFQLRKDIEDDGKQLNVFFYQLLQTPYLEKEVLVETLWDALKTAEKNVENIDASEVFRMRG